MGKLNTANFVEAEEVADVPSETIENEINWVDDDDSIFDTDTSPEFETEPAQPIEQVVEPNSQGDQVESKQVELAAAFEEEPEIIWDEEIEKRKDEKHFFDRLHALNEAIESAKEILNEAKENAKIAKDTLSVAVAQLQSFVSKGVQYRTKPTKKPKKEEAAQEDSSFQPNVIPDSEWRSWGTDTILEGIEGLGSKKREALLEHFPTFGKLMDAREESGREHISFHTLLPKGIGESIGTEIINRMDSKIVPGVHRFWGQV